MDADYILQELCWGGNDIARPFIKRINDYILNDQNVGQYALAFLLSPDGHFTAKSILKGCYEYPDPQKNTYRKKKSSRKFLLNMWWILILMRNNIRFSNHELDDLLDKEDVILENFDESDSEEPLQKNTRIVKRGGEKKYARWSRKCILGWWFFAFKSCIDLTEANLIFSTGKFGNASIHVSNKICWLHQEDKKAQHWWSNTLLLGQRYIHEQVQQSLYHSCIHFPSCQQWQNSSWRTRR